MAAAAFRAAGRGYGVRVELAQWTTLRLGGPARRVVEADGEDALVAAVREADRAGDPVLVLAGGSNVVVADEGFDGTVVRVLSRGVVRRTGEHGRALLEVEAGEPWDPFVARCVADGLSGVEALSGIPGSVGATPIQNVGAYGQEVRETVATVRVLDRRTHEVADLSAAACAFGYRTSRFKREPGRWVVLRVTFELEPSALSRPVAYAELARRLGIAIGERAPLADVREAVLALRRGKGMVLDPADPDATSAGSFFTNPVLDDEAFAVLRERAAPDEPPAWEQDDGTVKTSAAWLIERAGFTKGHGDPAGIAISSKHTLALTNRGGGSTAQLVALAQEVAGGVRERFGVDLVPEPVFVGHRWDPVPAAR
ncbi:UDP-N-acetylmuramate dehydrogenase [Conexibacter sp. SYSU D00693]|uniref:UDP-N-acetylmuramate dehydrogenase n=1 Tax=Conexibacter sp. SYSU D00693 TaxID=2812560 RepID=UPI00196B2C6B|nr:UDP-N-acetylmuramate dehydrogenase [Conexibacter sp. SYSU D00693]